MDIWFFLKVELTESIIVRDRLCKSKMSKMLMTVNEMNGMNEYINEWTFGCEKHEWKNIYFEIRKSTRKFTWLHTVIQ